MSSNPLWCFYLTFFRTFFSLRIITAIFTFPFLINISRTTSPRAGRKHPPKLSSSLPFIHTSSHDHECKSTNPSISSFFQSTPGSSPGHSLLSGFLCLFFVGEVHTPEKTTIPSLKRDIPIRLQGVFDLSARIYKTHKNNPKPSNILTLPNLSGV
jgi:hypothetical protein